MSILAPYIKALSERLGLDLELSGGNIFMAQLGEYHLLIEALPNSEALLFYMEVGRVDLPYRGEVLTTLMGGNLFLAETHGATLSYDAINEMVGLNLILPLRSLDSEEFINAVDNIVATAVDWGKKLQQISEEAKANSAQAQPSPAAAPDTKGTAHTAEGSEPAMLRV